jgi:hypothetical protein
MTLWEPTAPCRISVVLFPKTDRHEFGDCQIPKDYPAFSWCTYQQA